MSNLQILRIKLSSLLELLNKLYEKLNTLVKECNNAKENKYYYMVQYFSYKFFINDIRDFTKILEDEICKEEYKRGLDK